MKERKIFISGKVPDSLENILSDLGRVVKLPAFNKLPEPVSSHGDMLIFKDSTGKIFVPKEYYDLNKELFQDMDLECVCEEFSDKYPEDVYLDALLLGDHLICKERYTAKKIKAGKKIKDVKQGYARCSVCLLGRRAAITADGGIAKRLEELGSKTLIISAGDICLEGYSYGFIGGASCVIDDKVIFFGDITGHPAGGKILDFVAANGYEAVYPEDFPLTDLGSAVVV